VCAFLLALYLLPAVPAAAKQGDYTVGQRRVLREYARDTWNSFVELVEPATGLPADNISDDRVRSEYTSPTNIGTYLWSTIAARDIGIISRPEARRRLSQTLSTLARMGRSTGGAQPRCAGQYFNWYDPATGEQLLEWPVDGGKLYPFLSSVDNGWLAAALIMVANAEPPLKVRAKALADTFDFGCYYDPQVGQIRGGYWPGETPPGGWTPQVSGAPCGTRRPEDPPTGGFTCFHYGTHNTEPRIASYIGIAMGDIPREHYFRTWRTFPDSCDWSWPETKPVGEYRSYLGVNVFEGAYEYRDKLIVPTWGGSMFEALMVPLLVPEEEWGPRSWGINHPLYVEAQIEHGLEEARYGYWGFSPSNNPDGGYREYGVDAIGMNPDGYASDQERTLVDYGFPGCGRDERTVPTSYGEGVVTPHASFLALEYAPEEALSNLAKLRENFDAYGWGGFWDAIEVKSGTVSKYYLALDNGMIIAALGNALTNDRLQRYFTRGPVERKLKPLLAIEEFNAGRTELNDER